VQISFVIPVFNQVEHTRACLASLQEHVDASISHEIILVDDGSGETTRSFLKDLDEKIMVITLSENQGFARATNSGAAVAQGDWLCLLNNDVELTAGAMTEMLAVAQANPRAGIVGNVQVYADSGHVDHAGIKFIDRGYPVHERPTIDQITQRAAATSSVAVTAACCLVRRNWFINVGGLDDRYRNGFEDVDLCLRAREAGWDILVANRSVVRHAVSASEGRGRHEFRNAVKFLERWGPRTAEIEHAEEVRQAREFRLARHESRGEVARPSSSKPEPPVVWIDLLRMDPKGANGGIKPLVYQLIQAMADLDSPALRRVVLAQAGLGDELTFTGADDVIALKSESGWSINDGSSFLRMSELELETSYPPDALYAPFGTSVFSRPNLPQISLLVDALHRDLPSALPIEEVNFREDNFKRVIAESSWIQTLANHGTDRLQHHFGVHPSRCFHTYAAVQSRLDSDAPATRPSELPSTPFFFYPANFWPHKNHEVLLTAYHRYRVKVGDDAWPLLLTGHPDERMKILSVMSSTLGLTDHVHFVGHLPDDAFRAVWHFAGALVFPSLHEGFGIPIVEAFSARLPVIASHTSVLPEVGGDACAWIDPRDPRNLADMLERIASDTSLRKKLIQAGQARLPRFSLQFEAAKLNHFLHSAACGLVP